jgi:hypothetical protein
MRPTLAEVLLLSKVRVLEGILIEQGSENKARLKSKDNNYSIGRTKCITLTFLQSDIC